MILDLHGFSQEEAISAILNFLLTFKMDEHTREATIITGKGIGTMFYVATEILDEEDIEYEIANDKGSIIINKTY